MLAQGNLINYIPGSAFLGGVFVGGIDQ